MLAGILDRYLQIYPSERPQLALLRRQIKAAEKLDDRRNFNGHITGSAIVLSSDGKQILFIHHKLFDVWQQPGGHWETDEPDPLEAAKREAEEETGVRLKSYEPLDSSAPLVPFDIDSHEVPARPQKDEPVHYHHDFRYVFTAEKTPLNPQEEEVSAAEWFKVDAPETNRIKRTMAKLKAAGLTAT
jgi:8-oxo-dGTP pyrophosphatase MutT (NUDIX family)